MGMLYNRLLIILNEEVPDSTYYHIALIMLFHCEKLGEMSINELSELCNVSKSTISKFIRFIGYADFSDFRYAAVFTDDKYGYRISYVNDVMNYMENHPLDSYILTILQDISATYMNMDWGKVDRLVKDIDAYKKVAAFGLLFSETAALDLQAKLAYNKKFIVTNLNDLKQDQYIRNAKKDTLIIVFSDSGMFIDKYQKIDDFAYKQAFANTKAKVVVITSNRELEKDPRVDYCICYQKTKDLCTHRIVYGVITDILAYKYREYKKKQAE